MKYKIHEIETNVTYDDIYDTVEEAKAQIEAYIKDDADPVDPRVSAVHYELVEIATAPKLVEKIFEPYVIENGTTYDVNMKSAGYEFDGRAEWSDFLSERRADDLVDSLYDGFCDIYASDDGNLYAAHTDSDGNADVWCRVSFKKHLLPQAEEIAERIRESDSWNMAACAELCRLADLEDELEYADGDTFEDVIAKAAMKFGVKII